MSYNKGRWTTYHLNHEFNSELKGFVDDTSNKGNTSELKGNTSTPKGNTSELKGNAYLPDLQSSSNAKGNTSEYIKGNTSEAKGNTSAPAKENTKQRLTREELQIMILKFCALEFYSATEIASHVGKNVAYLKKSVIPEMIEQNLLIRLFPSTINHPQQKYKKYE